MGLFDSRYSFGEHVINIKGQQFGGLLKMGDIVAVLNVLEYMRQINNNHNIKFYIPDSELQPSRDYVPIFRDFLLNNSSYLSASKGKYDFDGFVEIWSFRENFGNLIRIEDVTNLHKKICVFPLIDAEYNHERNWPSSLIQSILKDFSDSKYSGYEKIICSKLPLPAEIELMGFTISYDFLENLYHLRTCEYFVGGDTGTSHLVSIFNNPNRKSRFYYLYGHHGGWLSSFTKPFHTEGGNSKMIYYNPQLIEYSQKLHANILENLVTYQPFNQKMRFGIQRDGGYVLVEGHEYDFLISGGVGPDISFEIDFMNFHKIKGVILDGTVDMVLDIPNNLTFIKKNVGRVNNHDISNLIEYIKDYNNVFLKLDIEGGEWDLLTSEFSNYLPQVKQIVLEVHNIFANDSRIFRSLEILNLTHNIVHIHENNNCHDFVNIDGNNYPQTFELTLLRKDIRVRGLNDQKFPLVGLDFPNANYENHDLNFYPFVVKT